MTAKDRYHGHPAAVLLIFNAFNKSLDAMMEEAVSLERTFVNSLCWIPEIQHGPYVPHADISKRSYWLSLVDALSSAIIDAESMHLCKTSSVDAMKRLMEGMVSPESFCQRKKMHAVEAVANLRFALAYRRGGASVSSGMSSI